MNSGKSEQELSPAEANLKEEEVPSRKGEAVVELAALGWGGGGGTGLSFPSAVSRRAKVIYWGALGKSFEAIRSVTSERTASLVLDFF